MKHLSHNLEKERRLPRNLSGIEMKGKQAWVIYSWGDYSLSLGSIGSLRPLRLCGRLCGGFALVSPVDGFAGKQMHDYAKIQ